MSIDPHLEKLFRSVTLSTDTSVSRQITSKVREMILRGELAYATKLPSMHEIAQLLNTNYFTVQSALTPLVEEGLLERKRRVGTFVRWRFSVLNTAGLYLPEVILTNRRSGEFYRVLYGALQNLLSAQGTQTRSWIDHRSRIQRGTALPELLEAIERREIEFLYVIHCEESVMGWIKQLPIPMVAFTDLALPNRVLNTFDDFLDKSFAVLDEKNIRQCALIVPEGCPIPEKSKGRIPSEHIYHLSDPFDNSGYQLTKQLCANPNRPKALVVYPDVAAHGVIAALLESQTRVPEEMEVIFNKNRGIPLFHPFPATHIVMDTMKAAEIMEKTSRKIMSGEGPIEEEVQHLIQPVSVGTYDQEFLLQATRGSERIRLARPHPR